MTPGILRDEPCAHTLAESWWEYDGQGIPLCRVCARCRPGPEHDAGECPGCHRGAVLRDADEVVTHAR